MIPSFSFSHTPNLHFGQGTFSKLDSLINSFGKTVLIVTGKSSFAQSGKQDDLDTTLKSKNNVPYYFTVSCEPSPEIVDDAVSSFKHSGIDVVCAIGGGSVIDAGKAISAMLQQDGSVTDYLEGVETGKVHDGRKTPFIAVPTTSGTGSEATKNAVLSHVGPSGFKKSLRHNNFVADIAVIDPELSVTCPPDLTAAAGMDACAQLLESFVSTNATPLSDALAFSGMTFIGGNILNACSAGADNIGVRGAMAYASYLSGITLANAGLGTLHSLASSIGGLFDIPHGIICGTLLAPWAQITIENLESAGNNNMNGLGKFAVAFEALMESAENDIGHSCENLIRTLDEWTNTLEIPSLRKYGIAEKDVEQILDSTGNKNNPAELDREEIKRIVMMRL